MFSSGHHISKRIMRLLLLVSPNAFIFLWSSQSKQFSIRKSKQIKKGRPDVESLKNYRLFSLEKKKR